MINVGIIGFGKMGRIRAQAIEETDQAKIVSVYDNNPKAYFIFKVKGS